MATKPNKQTHTVRGKDAINFFTNIEQNSNKKIDADILLQIKKDAEKLKSIFKN